MTDWKCWVEECKEMHTEDSQLCTEHLDNFLNNLEEINKKQEGVD
jgi:hypothetical protein